MELEQPVLLFDGVCNLCEESVLFVLKHEQKSVLRFASQQSPIGQQLLKELGLSTQVENLVLIENSRAHTASEAALRTAAYLRRPWSWATLLLWIPAGLRDFVYGWIARNRYRWFGQKNSCWLPTPELQSRFLDHPNPQK
ncbi:MAG: DUF393 domain-containing protein [Myxococcales bacterium]|nr:DUF393 domain-containing protein [Myxococcales bacterium]